MSSFNNVVCLEFVLLSWFSNVLHHTEYAAPVFEMCPVYDIQNATLQLIESTWNEVVHVCAEYSLIFRCITDGGSWKLIVGCASG